ncbi:hypothetical protein H696_02800 [Fonticula alba]|uniref:Cytochrome b5 heme-binding domain-containing protein n=1 Tax=Fonticula alba TaxID=691883 RepID=A0A058Z867_FONAL|nr:hypothetical protein H696_02800 [Fonticula alba]KCV70459.1 hypothetical protein H696_02800 [Fonticula alba]|eukprot:XP_009494975.1 hypothetical protein H696_02800 [Fonticula alba]
MPPELSSAPTKVDVLGKEASSGPMRLFTWDEVTKACAVPSAEALSQATTSADIASTQAAREIRAGRRCLLILHDKVYDVTSFVPRHPGGPLIMTYSGEDAADAFQAFHPVGTFKMLAQYQIGEIAPSERIPPSPFVAEMRALRHRFQAEGLFEASKAYYAFKVLSTVAIVLLAGAVAHYWQTVPGAVVSALLVALFWQQCGWLAHDFVHHQVFENRRLGDLFGYMIGNFFQGFSVAWWKNKHNTHHAIPNVHKADPDVDLMPLLAWSEHALEAFVEGDVQGMSKILIDHQNFFYPLLLSFARLSWAIQSVIYVQTAADVPNRGLEALGLLGHWALLIIFSVLLTGPWRALIIFMVSNVACGLLLASVFSLNHNGMPILDAEENRSYDFFTRQIITGRDVHPSVFNTWFTGGLNYQIEHHLFPSIPRHNFHRIQPRVAELCRKYNVPYHTAGLISGTVEVFKRLAEVAHASRQVSGPKTD